jgi:hypothetical protein
VVSTNYGYQNLVVLQKNAIICGGVIIICVIIVKERTRILGTFAAIVPIGLPLIILKNQRGRATEGFARSASLSEPKAIATNFKHIRLCLVKSKYYLNHLEYVVMCCY